MEDRTRGFPFHNPLYGPRPNRGIVIALERTTTLGPGDDRLLVSRRVRSLMDNFAKTRRAFRVD